MAEIPTYRLLDEYGNEVLDFFNVDPWSWSVEVAGDIKFVKSVAFGATYVRLELE